MNPTASSLSRSSTHPTFPRFTAPKWDPHHHRTTSLTITSAARRRHHRRRHLRRPDNPSPLQSDSKLQMVIDLEYMPDKASVTLNRLLRLAETKYKEFVDSGIDAYEDLRSLITVSDDRRVVVSCRRSTVYFVGNLVILGLVTVFAFRVFVNLGLGFRNLFRSKSGDEGVVIRKRDRSLGGREVVVGKQKEVKREFSDSVNPLSSVEESLGGFSSSMMKNWGRKTGDKLPKWWPVSVAKPVAVVDRGEYQRKANWLIRAILDYRTSGKDIHVDDIILLRQICRMSGVSVSIDTANSRDSLYRASINFTLNICSSAGSHSSFVQIDGEDAREFIAGLADNIGLEKVRAARMLAAAVAARTRSWLLQAWALEMQGQHVEAVEELSKLCLIHRIFPPEEGSPEMEMVARGLEKHLKLEQREYLLKMLTGICSEESYKSVSEALGLAISSGSVGHQQENKII